MSSLDRFFTCPREGERVIGTYLYPWRLFGNPDSAHPSSATEVVRTIAVGTHNVLVTRMGGLFVRPPEALSDPYGSPPDSADLFSDLQAKMSFEEEVAEAFNQIICELALMGIVSEPASPVHISYGQLIDGHALAVVGSGGRETYLERTIGPSLALVRGDWRTWQVNPEAVLDEAANRACTARLVSISETLSVLVPGAYYHFSRRQLSEALMDSWIVTEQILDHLWETYVSTLSDKPRRKRLSDPRTYTAAIRTEVLHVAGVVNATLSDAIHTARGHRNDLAHRAKITLSAANDCLTAMKAVVELVCQTSVAQPMVSTGVNW